jgi:hypothetical protein
MVEVLVMADKKEMVVVVQEAGDLDPVGPGLSRAQPFAPGGGRRWPEGRAPQRGRSMDAKATQPTRPSSPSLSLSC